MKNFKNDDLYERGFSLTREVEENDIEFSFFERKDDEITKISFFNKNQDKLIRFWLYMNKKSDDIKISKYLKNIFNKIEENKDGEENVKKNRDSKLL